MSAGLRPGGDCLCRPWHYTHMQDPTPDSRRLQYLDALGVDVWRERQPPEATDGADEPASETVPADWDELQATVAACTRCALHKTRTQTVFGVGSKSADWMIVGEAPGAEEDRRGEPFVGRAGKLLDEMLYAVGLDRQSVFIANVLKCRPPNNRDPSPDEAGQCRPYLDRQIALVAPRLILAVGRIAAQQLLGSDAPLGRLRGKVHAIGEPAVPVVVTYHPAYLLRSPTQKSKAWQDLCLAKDLFERQT